MVKGSRTKIMILINHQAISHSTDQSLRQQVVHISMYVKELERE